MISAFGVDHGEVSKAINIPGMPRPDQQRQKRTNPGVAATAGGLGGAFGMGMKSQRPGGLGQQKTGGLKSRLGSKISPGRAAIGGLAGAAGSGGAAMGLNRMRKPKSSGQL